MDSILKPTQAGLTKGLWPPLEIEKSSLYTCSDRSKLERHIEYETKLAYHRSNCMSMVNYAGSVNQNISTYLQTLLMPIARIDIEKKNIPSWLKDLITIFRHHPIEDMFCLIEGMTIEKVRSLYQYCQEIFVDNHKRIYLNLVNIRRTPQGRANKKSSSGETRTSKKKIRANHLSGELLDNVLELNKLLLRYALKEQQVEIDNNDHLDNLSKFSQNKHEYCINKFVDMVNYILEIASPEFEKIKDYLCAISSAYENKIDKIIKGLFQIHNLITHYPEWLGRESRSYTPPLEGRFWGLRSSIQSSDATFSMLNRLLNEKYPMYSPLFDTSSCKGKKIHKKATDGPHALDHIISEIRIPGLIEYISTRYKALLETNHIFLRARVMFFVDLSKAYGNLLIEIYRLIGYYQDERTDLSEYLERCENILTHIKHTDEHYKKIDRGIDDKSPEVLNDIEESFFSHDKNHIKQLVSAKLLLIDLIQHPKLSHLMYSALKSMEFDIDKEDSSKEESQYSTNNYIWSDDIDRLANAFQSLTLDQGFSL